MDKKGCIIVPYRDREEHLSQFIPHYRKLLPDMPIYVIEQADSRPFNRGKLLNVGFLEVNIDYDYCVLHDVDMLAENSEGYEYYEYPVHLATACSQFNYRMPFPDYFGGVVNMPTYLMHVFNGFGNEFWGWGAEDCAFRKRIEGYGQDIYDIPNKRYLSLSHERAIDEKEYNKNLDIYRAGLPPYEGLASCKYEVIKVDKNEHYTHIHVKL